MVAKLIKKLVIFLEVSSMGAKEVRKTKKSSFSQTRSTHYKTARILGDIQEISKGKAGKRIVRRLAGRATGRLLGKLFR